MAEAPLAVCESDKNLQAMLTVLRDKEEPVEVRLGRDGLAGSAASASSPSNRAGVITLQPCARWRWTRTLSSVRACLGLLAGLKDGFAQKKLLDGLEDPLKALVRPRRHSSFSAMTCTQNPTHRPRDCQQSTERRCQARGPAAARRGREVRRRCSRSSFATKTNCARLGKSRLRRCRRLNRRNCRSMRGKYCSTRRSTKTFKPPA